MNPKKWTGRILVLALIFSFFLSPSGRAAGFLFESQTPAYYAESQEIQVVFTNRSDKPVPISRMDSQLYYSASPGVTITRAQIRNIEFDRSKLVTVNKEACLPSGGSFKVWINYQAKGLGKNRELKSVETQPVPLKAMEKFRTVDGAVSFKVGNQIVFSVYIGRNKTSANQAYQGPTYAQPRRISGSTRYDTALALAKDYPSAPAVVIARGDDFADALAATPLAHSLGGPILLNPTDKLRTDVSKEIRRLRPRTIYIVGGTSAISGQVESALQGQGRVVRLRGQNRFDTSVAIAKELRKQGGQFVQAFVTTGTNFADALAVSPLAAQSYLPILLVTRDSLPPEVKEGMEALQISQTVIVGGDAAVSDRVARALPGAKQRLSGSNRYETAAVVASNFPDAQRAYLTVGDNFPDALAAGPLAARYGAPILLTGKNALPGPTASVLQRTSASNQVFLVGGDAVISEAVASQVRSYQWIRRINKGQ
ncbi:cell wall-binding repeat-containing protein [Kallipyga gabonensis]|uniref:cell wall-binding repeat-containing protein n=1 Tax=Kallipyga gabonensis TaxID=1686287 RepID=UPI0006B5B39F|nr:cell wall-binding repeat-containing protein [Kallipyga gabonensis]